MLFYLLLLGVLEVLRGFLEATLVPVYYCSENNFHSWIPLSLFLLLRNYVKDDQNFVFKVFYCASRIFFRLVNLQRRLQILWNGSFLRVSEAGTHPDQVMWYKFLNFSRSCTCDVGETKTIKKRRLSLQQNCKRIAREYDERKFAFCVLETDFKKFAFTTVEATTEVLLIKQKKGASYN